MKQEKIIYTILDKETGEVFKGKSSVVAKRMGMNGHNMVPMYYQKKHIYKGRYQFLGREKVVEQKVVKKVNYDYLIEKNIRNLDPCKVHSLHDAYVSGRSNFWTIENIADECGVPVEIIKETLKKPV